LASCSDQALRGERPAEAAPCALQGITKKNWLVRACRLRRAAG